MKKGLLITFEGVEGSGKSTQIKRLAQALSARRVRHLVTKEPGDSSFGKMVRDSLLNKRKSTVTHEAELYLFMADRSDHVTHTIRPALLQGKIVLCDRFSDSTLAYQGGGRRFDLKFLEANNRVASHGMVPDITFLFDVPVTLGLQRVLKRGKGRKDGIEKEQLKFHNGVRAMYLKLAKANPRRIVRLDGRQDPDLIHQEVLNTLTGKAPAVWRKALSREA
jgi:dTMP kinase